MQLDSLIDSIQYPLTLSEKELLIKAFIFAQQKHEGQKRNSGEPYFNHVYQVAFNCTILGADCITVCAALLHDILEDTQTTEAQLEQEFGPEIFFLVNGVTKLGKIKYRGTERHVESMRKFFLAIATDLRVLIIKLADRLHNITTLSHVPPEKQRRIALETIEIHAQLAGRLGMGKLKGMLEDGAFPFAYPEEYKQTQNIKDQLVPNAKEIIAKIQDEIIKTLTDFKIESSVDARVKHTYSLYRKLMRYDNDPSRIYDIVALRIVVPTEVDCYQALGLMHMLWKPLPGRIKDYIALPKPNGYKSLHTTVATPFGIIEIQIRTNTMHEESEFGVASHLIYKEKSTGHNLSSKQKINWLEQLREFSEQLKDVKEMNELKLDILKNRIFVFTPKGDVVDLPEESSPIDFAYTIHSEIGDKICGAKINGKMSAINTELKNGDIIEIITSKNAHPSNKWLDRTKTTIARKKIRSYIEEHSGLVEKFFLKK